VPLPRTCPVAVAAIASGLFFHAVPAHADDGWAIDATAAVGTGLEGGDSGGGKIQWHRARTRILAGFDLRSDENEKDSFGLRAFAEIEKRGGVGGEGRYERWLSRGVGGYVHAVAVIAPETLVGAGFGATFVIPFGKRAGFAIEPGFTALPLGSDVPDGSVVMWATLTLGVRLGL
jgi:hypothetical protein